MTVDSEEQTKEQHLAANADASHRDGSDISRVWEFLFAGSQDCQRSSRNFRMRRI
jgi:hypothetical protein